MIIIAKAITYRSVECLSVVAHTARSNRGHMKGRGSRSAAKQVIRRKRIAQRKSSGNLTLQPSTRRGEETPESHHAVQQPSHPPDVLHGHKERGKYAARQGYTGRRLPVVEYTLSNAILRSYTGCMFSIYKHY